MFDNAPTVHVRAWWRPGRAIEVVAYRFRVEPTDEQRRTMDDLVGACAHERTVATAVRSRLGDHPQLSRLVRLHTSWVGDDRSTEPTADELTAAAEAFEAQVADDEANRTGV